MECRNYWFFNKKILAYTHVEKELKKSFDHELDSGGMLTRVNVILIK
jgi:hypothetical protein